MGLFEALFLGGNANRNQRDNAREIQRVVEALDPIAQHKAVRAYEKLEAGAKVNADREKEIAEAMKYFDADAEPLTDEGELDMTQIIARARLERQERGGSTKSKWKGGRVVRA